MYFISAVVYTADHKFISIGWEKMQTSEFAELSVHNDNISAKLIENNIDISDIIEVNTLGFVYFLVKIDSDAIYIDSNWEYYGTICGMDDNFTHGISLDKLNIVG